MAVDFLARHRLHDRPCRFDVVTVDVSEASPPVEVYHARVRRGDAVTYGVTERIHSS